MTVEPFGGTSNFEGQQARSVFASRRGGRHRAFATVLASTHAPLLALLVHGDLSFVASIVGRRTTGSALAFTVGATVLGSAVSVRELRRDRTLRSLEEISNSDPLTGVYNRRAGEERLAQDLARASCDGRTTTLMALDLDGLKGLNDYLGHPAGDALLKRVADALRRNLREGDWLARWGGDEFVLGLWNAPDPDAAAKVLERAACQLRSEVLPVPHPPRVTFSAGVVSREPGDDPGRIVARADALLYEAKRRCGSASLREAPDKPYQESMSR